jgi:hypothetical protein
MPAVSQAQRRFLNARFGHAWVRQHHFDNKGRLPAYAKTHDKRKAALARLLAQRQTRRK